MSDPLRIGIVGAGANTRAKHIPGLQALPGVEIVSVCNRSRASSERVAADFGIPDVANHWTEVVDDARLDAVVIGTWPYLHAPITLAALEAGKHVLCEARMAMDAIEARQMRDLALACPGQVAQIVPSPFTLPWDATIRRVLAEGSLGEILAVDVFANCGAFADPARAMTWREDPALSGNNILMMGIYYEALARWLGHARDIDARGKVCVRQRKDGEGRRRWLEIPDHLDVWGELACGASLHMRCSQVTGACPTPNDFLIYGSTGTLRLDLTAKRLTLHRPGGSAEEIAVLPGDRGEWRVEAEFIGAIRGEESVRLTTFEEGLRYMEFTDAVRESLG
jgi:predicted dehydrogenase